MSWLCRKYVIREIHHYFVQSMSLFFYSQIVTLTFSKDKPFKNIPYLSPYSLEPTLSCKHPVPTVIVMITLLFEEQNLSCGCSHLRNCICTLI